MEGELPPPLLGRCRPGRGRGRGTSFPHRDILYAWTSTDIVYVFLVFSNKFFSQFFASYSIIIFIFVLSWSMVCSKSFSEELCVRIRLISYMMIL